MFNIFPRAYHQSFIFYNVFNSNSYKDDLKWQWLMSNWFVVFAFHKMIRTDISNSFLKWLANLTSKSGWIIIKIIMEITMNYTNNSINTSSEKHQHWNNVNFLLTAYSNCVNEPFCAARTIQGYMKKFGKVRRLSIFGMFGSVLAVFVKMFGSSKVIANLVGSWNRLTLWQDFFFVTIFG